MLAAKLTAKLNEEPVIRWAKPAGEIDGAPPCFLDVHGSLVRSKSPQLSCGRSEDIGLYHDRPELDGAIFAFVQDTDPEVLL